MNDCNKCIVKGVRCSKINASCKAIREISEQSIRQFAEWLSENEFIKEYNWTSEEYEVISADIIIAMYNEEQK